MKFHLTAKLKYEERVWGKRGSEFRWVAKRDLTDGWTLVLYEDIAVAQRVLDTLVQSDQWCVCLNEQHDVKIFMPYNKEKVMAQIEKVTNGTEL